MCSSSVFLPTESHILLTLVSPIWLHANASLICMRLMILEVSVTNLPVFLPGVVSAYGNVTTSRM